MLINESIPANATPAQLKPMKTAVLPAITTQAALIHAIIQNAALLPYQPEGMEYSYDFYQTLHPPKRELISKPLTQIQLQENEVPAMQPKRSCNRKISTYGLPVINLTPV